MNPQKSRALLALLFTGVLMGALDLSIVGPALPAIQADFGIFPIAAAVIGNTLPPRERDTAQGLLSNFTSMGRLVGAALVGTIAASVGSGAVGYQAAFLGMTVVAGILVVLGLTLSARSAGEAEEVQVVVFS